MKLPKYRSFHMQKRLKRQTTQRIPGSIALLRASLKLLKGNWKVFLGIAAVFGILNLVLVTGFSVVNLNEAKQSFGAALNGQLVSQVTSGLGLFVYLLGSSNTASANPTAGVYRLVLMVVVSLAIIWALRQVHAGSKIRIRDTFYQGMYPLVPFTLVLLAIGLQLLPIAIGVMLYGTVMGNGIAVTFVEQVLWSMLLVLLSLASIYMLTSSLFALYIVSLPNMSPMAALRSARQLVLHRRWTLIRKILFMPVALVILCAVILTPIIILATPAAPWVFLVISMFLLPLAYSYLYTLYRSLL